jgi:hypothetical protein
MGLRRVALLRRRSMRFGTLDTASPDVAFITTVIVCHAPRPSRAAELSAHRQLVWYRRLMRCEINRLRKSPPSPWSQRMICC